MIREVVRMGAPLLDRPSGEVPPGLFGTAALEGLVVDMADTMEETGGIGIAAPQVGVALRVAWIGEVPESGQPAMALINPVIEPVPEAGTSEALEGCLSVPGMRGVVRRANAIRWKARNIQGEEISGTAEGFLARVIQHECDHLDGIVYVHRIEDMHLFGCSEEMAEAWKSRQQDKAAKAQH